jgi:hypothetical protein
MLLHILFCIECCLRISKENSNSIQFFIWKCIWKIKKGKEKWKSSSSLFWPEGLLSSLLGPARLSFLIRHEASKPAPLVRAPRNGPAQLTSHRPPRPSSLFVSLPPRACLSASSSSSSSLPSQTPPEESASAPMPCLAWTARLASS